MAIDGEFIGIGARLADPTAATPNGGRAYMYHYPLEFASYCFADRGDCPCNDDPSAGCLNSTGNGGLLTATGSASLAANDLELRVTGAPGSSSMIGLVSLNAQRVPLRDGLLCVSGPIVRIGVRTASATGTATFGVPATIAVPMPASGDELNYQVWYRDVTTGACGHGSNLTNAVQVRFAP